MEVLTTPLVSDLQVRREKISVIRPEKIKERGSFFLSNIDQNLVGFVLKTLHFFAFHPDIPFDAIVQLSTQALSKILVAYDFMCGRLTFNLKQRRFEIDCNAAGVPLAICTSPLSLEELGDIKYPNPALSQLCLLPGHKNKTPEDEQLMSFQEFVKNFSQLAVKGEIAILPVIDRTRLMARSPPHIIFDHQEYIKLSEIDHNTIIEASSVERKEDLVQTKSAFISPLRKYDYRVFSLSGKMLDALKVKAEDGGVKHCTTFMAALAQLWRARTAAININEDDVSTVQFLVDIRSKLRPPLPKEFVGNAILTAYAKATAKELEEQPFCEIVKKLEQGVERLTDEYLKSRIDWLELHDAVACVENGFFVSTWSHMGFKELELASEIKAMYGGLVVEEWEKSVIFMNDPKDDNGIMIHLGLEVGEMARFQTLIQNVNPILTKIHLSY